MVWCTFVSHRALCRTKFRVTQDTNSACTQLLYRATEDKRRSKNISVIGPVPMNYAAVRLELHNNSIFTLDH